MVTRTITAHTRLQSFVDRLSIRPNSVALLTIKPSADRLDTTITLVCLNLEPLKTIPQCIVPLLLLVRKSFAICSLSRLTRARHELKILLRLQRWSCMLPGLFNAAFSN